jgi:hypothetical protein
MPPLLFTPGKYLVPIVQEAVWAPGPVCTGVENLNPTGIRYTGRIYIQNEQKFVAVFMCLNVSASYTYGEL